MASNPRTTNTTSNTPSLPFFGNSTLPPPRSIAASTFLSADESISIIPSFNYPAPIGLISGQVGPFRAGTDTVVPLWLGTMLRRRKLAKIVPPSWMDVDLLKEVLRFERDPKEASFSADLPFRHAEISRAILSACRAGSGTGSAAGEGGDSEIPNADQIKLLLEDIATVRMDKIRRNVHTLSTQTLSQVSKGESIIDVTNIGSLEMHAVKGFVGEAFRLHRELSGKGSSYSYPLSGAEQPRSGGRGTVTSSSDTAASAGGGRLRASRLRDNTDGGEKNSGEADENDNGEVKDRAGENNDMDASRSRIRRHR